MYYELFKILSVVIIVSYCMILYKVNTNEKSQVSKFFIAYLLVAISNQVANYLVAIDGGFFLNHLFYKIASATTSFLVPFWILMALMNTVVESEYDVRRIPISTRLIHITFLPAILYTGVLLFTPMDSQYYRVEQIFRLMFQTNFIVVLFYAISLIVLAFYTLKRVQFALKMIKDTRKYFLYFCLVSIGFYIFALLSVVTSYSISYLSFSLISFLAVYVYYIEIYNSNNFVNTNAILTVAMGRMQQPFFVCNAQKEVVGINDAVKEIIPEFKYSNQYKQKIYNIPSLSSIATELDKDSSRVSITLFTDECVRYLEASISCVVDKGRILGYGIVVYDQTALTIALQKQKRLAEEDYLTGVYNRRTFMRQANIQLATANENKDSYAVLMLDLDNFKNINDTYSHLAGDEVLVRFANAVRRTIDNKKLFARYGGEEFCILMTDYDEKEVIEYAERLNNLIREMEIHFNNAVITLTVSIGIYYVESGKKIPFANALAEADEALYQSKTTGKDKYTIFKL